MQARQRTRLVGDDAQLAQTQVTQDLAAKAERAIVHRLGLRRDAVRAGQVRNVDVLMLGTADLQQPDFETRIAIINNKMESEGIEIPEDVVEYLAYSVDTNIRELEGVLISLIAQAMLNRKDIDLELAKQVLKNIVHDIESEVGIDYIQKTVSEYYKLKVDQLKDKTRKKEIVIARQIAMYFSKEYTNHSLKSIGYHFGGRDHSTVIHAVHSINDLMDTNSHFKNSVEDIKKKLKIRSVH